MEEINNKRSVIYIPIIIAVTLVAGMFLGNILIPAKNNKSNKFSEVLSYIQNSYVDSVNKNQMTEIALTALLQELDPHSYYIPASELKETNDNLYGSFDGIGVEFNILKDTVIVVDPIAGGPSEKIGIRAGDRIVKVNGSIIAGVKISNKNVMQKLKGPKGTKVKVSILRRGIPHLLEFTIIRDKIPTYSVDISYMVTNNIGYVKISKFSATTYNEFESATSSLLKSGMKKLIVDLRGNAGGYLDAAIKLSDEFLSKGKLIVYTEGRNRPKTTAYATSEGNLEKIDLVILIDEFSASASEILAGAIQDNDRGLVIGRRSFGKGLVQEQVELNDGSAIRLTIARYFTPTGRSIQKPYKNGVEQYYNEFYNRFTDGELLNADSIHFADSLKYKTPKGHIVYGGGGIMPDIFIPIDTTDNSRFYTNVVNKGLMYQFALDYSDQNRNLKTKYGNFDNFNKYFIINTEIIDQFLYLCEKNGVKNDKNSFKKSENKIKLQLKALIARNLYNDSGYYPIILSIDKTFKKAVEELNNLNN